MWRLAEVERQRTRFLELQRRDIAALEKKSTKPAQPVEAKPRKKRRQRGRRGGGSIYKHPGSRNLYISWTHGLKRMSMSTGSPELIVAQQMLAEKLSAARAQTPAPNLQLTIQDLFDAMIRQQETKGRKSIACTRYRWNKHLKSDFGRMKSTALSVPLLESYIRNRREKQHAAKASVNRELGILRASYLLGIQRGMISYAPCFKGLMLDESDNVRDHYVSEQEFAKIMFHIRELPIRTIVETAYRLGWRYSELLALRVRHLDVENHVLRLDAGSTKNSDSRAVPLEPDLFNLLSACAGRRKPQEWLFVREDGSRVREMRHTWQRACVAAGLAHWVHKTCYRAAVREHGVKNVDPKDFVPNELHRCPSCEARVYHTALKYCGVIFHDTRRAAATNMIRRGIPALTAMKFTGHRTLKMFSRYKLAEMEELQAASKKMAEARQLELAELARKGALSLRYAEVGAGDGISEPSRKVQ